MFGNCWVWGLSGHSWLEVAHPRARIQEPCQLDGKAADLNLRWSGQNVRPTTIIGPPTSGTRVLNEFWRDALGGEFRCTVAGTPGTWIQIRSAAVTADPSSGTIPVGYWIWNTTTGHLKRHAGGYAWEATGA